MARIRSVKPALRTSQVVASWPREVRYFFVLLWGYLDDDGRGLDVPKTIAGDCFPHDEDVPPAKINRWLDLMAKTKVDPTRPPPICRYEVAGRRYIHCVNFDEHQHPNRPTRSVIPRCPVHESLTESSSEPDSEPPLSPRVLEVDSRKLTAGEVDSSGAEAPHGERLTAAAAMIVDRTDATPAEAEAVAALVAKERKPRNLPGFVRSLADDELAKMLADLRRNAEGSEIAALIAAARRGSPCRHGDPGGAFPHPATGKPLCPLCRQQPTKEPQ